MKRILSFLICAIAFCANAATNTVLTTTTNRVLAISATGSQLVSSNSVTDMRSLLSVPSAASLTTVSNSVTTLQTQLPGYATNYGASLTNAAITGGTVTSQTNTDLTASRALVSDANKKLSSSSVTSTELGYVSGVTSAIQTQIDAKATAANLTTVSNTVTTQGNTLSTNTALLNGTNVLTGTNNFTGTVLITNAASTISGNGAGLTNLNGAKIASGFMRPILWTNLYITNIPFQVGAPYPPAVSFTMPPSASPWSKYFLTYSIRKYVTGSTTTYNFLAAKDSSSYDTNSTTTNLVTGSSMGSTIMRQEFGLTKIMSNLGTFTNHSMGYSAAGTWATTTNSANCIFDTTTNWSLGIWFGDSVSATQALWIDDLTVYEAAPTYP